jgi:hypothetical protein
LVINGKGRVKRKNDAIMSENDALNKIMTQIRPKTTQ